MHTFSINSSIQIIYKRVFRIIFNDNNQKSSNRYWDILRFLKIMIKRVIIAQILCVTILMHRNNANGSNLFGFDPTSPNYFLCIGCFNSSIEQGRHYYESNLNISNCFFSRIQEFDGDGGVIFCTKECFQMILTKITFLNCSCSNVGGAVFSLCRNSNSSMICANMCSAMNIGQFAYFKLNNNHEFMSVSRCSDSQKGSYSILFENGNVQLTNMNSSLNRVHMCSCLASCYPASYSCNWSTFANNYAYESSCLLFERNSGVNIFINIVNNNSPHDNGVIYLFDNSAIDFIYCAFINNQDTLFFITTFRLKVINSVISHHCNLSIGPLIQSNISDFKETYKIPHFKTKYCHADVNIDDQCIQNLDSNNRYIENDFVQISDCFFSRSIDYIGSGGIIFVDVREMDLNILKTVFNNCSSTIKAGAIFFQSSNSYIDKVCAYQCSSMKCFFSYIRSNIESTNKYVSISACSYKPEGSDPIDLQDGIQRISYTNISNNYAKGTSGLSIYYSQELSIYFCHFENNNSSHGECIKLYSQSGLISQTSVIHNIVTITESIVSVEYGNCLFEYSVFHDNVNTLFIVCGGSLDVIHCLISHNDIIAVGRISTMNCTNTFVPFEHLYFYTFLCNSDLNEPKSDYFSKKRGISPIIFCIFFGFLLLALMMIIIIFTNKNNPITQSFNFFQEKEDIRSDFQFEATIINQTLLI